MPSDDWKNKRAMDSFTRGFKALSEQNWDYSCEMFRRCVKLVPENLLFRQSLRDITEKKYQNNGTGAMSSERQLLLIWMSISKAKEQEDWSAVTQHCEDGLAINPWDAELNAELGQALNALGIKDAALWCFQRAVKESPENKHYWFMAGRISKEVGKRDEALHCFQQVLNLDPGDADARHMIVTMGPAPRPTASPSEILSGAQVVEQESLASDPCEAELSEFREAFRRAKEQAFLKPHDREAIDNYAIAKERLLEREVEVYSQAIQQDPTNVRAKYNLGLSYMQSKMYSQALPLFEQSRHHPKYKCLSLVNLGKCLVYKKMLRPALAMFEMAALEVDMGQEETRLEIEYFIDRIRRELDNDGPDGGAGILVPA